MPLKFLHDRDCGDVIFSLASIQSLGGGSLYLKNRAIHKLLATLIDSQEYIHECLPWNIQKYDHDFSIFRRGGIPYGVRLAELHSKWIGAEVDFSLPWLSVKPNRHIDLSGKIVINRTPRYNNHLFPWKSLVSQLGKHMVFIGLESEHKSFCHNFGRVDYLKTRDFLEVAQAIASSELFIGNQSSANAIAEGLKHSIIQEVSLSVPDCLFPRYNAIHCINGGLGFTFGDMRFHAEAPIFKKKLNIQSSPPGGWTIEWDDEVTNSYDLNLAVSQLKYRLQEKGKEVPPNLKEMVVNKLTLNQPLTGIPLQVERAKELLQDLHSKHRDSVSNLSLSQSSGIWLS